MVVAWGIGAFCFTNWFPLHAVLQTLSFLWNKRKVVPCLCFDENFEKTCLSVQSTGPGRAGPDAAAAIDTFSLLFFLSGSQQPGVPYYTDPGGPVMNPMAMAFHVQPNSPQGNPVYPPPPSYCNTPPPPYEQVVKSSTWGLSGSVTWLCEKKVPLQNERDGGHLPFWTLASSPSPPSLPSLHLSSLKLLAKGWFLNFFSFLFFSRSEFFLCLQNERSCLCNAFNGNLYLKPICLSLYLLFVSVLGLIATGSSSLFNPRVMCALLRPHSRNALI